MPEFGSVTRRVARSENPISPLALDDSTSIVSDCKAPLYGLLNDGAGNSVEFTKEKELISKTAPN